MSAERNLATCPASAQAMDDRADAALVGGTFAAGGAAFEDAGTFVARRPGRYRICAYLSTSGQQAAPARRTATAIVTSGEPDRPDSVAINVAPTFRAGESTPLRLTGYVTDNGVLYAYTEPDGADCAPTRDAHAARPTTASFGVQFPDPGAFDVPYDTRANRAGTFRICAYLEHLDDPDNAPPRATATQTVTATPAPDGDGDGVADTEDKCPTASGTQVDGCPPPPSPPSAPPSSSPTATKPVLGGATSFRLSKRTISVRGSCARACKLVASAKIGKRTLRSATVRGPATLRIRLSKATARSLRSRAGGKGLKVTVTVRATYATGEVLTTKRTVRLER